MRISDWSSDVCSSDLLIVSGQAKKGDVLGTARIAGIMAAKRTHELIPLCHPLALSQVTVELTPNTAENAIDIVATCKLTGRTGEDGRGTWRERGGQDV